MPALPHEIRAALRGIRSAPTLSLAIVATLAVAIGANTVIFSAVDGILLKSLPFGNAPRLVAFTPRDRGGDADVSARDFTDWRREIRGLGAMAAWEVGVALLASWVPARRAASVDPAITMRAE